MMRDVVTVPLGSRRYDVVVGQGLLADAGTAIGPLLTRPKVAVVTDETVAALHLNTLSRSLDAQGIAQDTLRLPPGEASKSWRTLELTTDWLMARNVERGDVVVALGGGVIGDLAGFAAAILRRGVRFVQIPTSLLAQVDSSVGGKTGINTAAGKNLVGAFHQPALVLADTDLLSTLPPRQFRSGYAEVVKYGLLGDAAFFDWLEASGPGLASGDPAARRHAVTRSVQAKSDVVTADETETAGRALLNLGHTFGHALESATGYSDRLLHGEGVAIGCALAFDLSARLGLCPAEAPSRIRAHFSRMGLPTGPSGIPGTLPDAEALLDLMGQDKKVVHGRLRLILAKDIGQAFVAEDIPRDDILAVLRSALADR